MFTNYLKITLRLIRRNKIYSFINIAGLASGIAACILILFWVTDEMTFNYFHEKLDRIYLVAQTQHYKTAGAFTVSPTPSGLAHALEEEYPEILLATRYTPYLGPSVVSYEDNYFYERIDFADPQFFQIFTFPFVKGNSTTAFAEPYSIVITEKIARKYFGREDPIGKIVHVDGKYDFKVTGVVQDIPPNSDIHFTFLASFESLPALGYHLPDWESNSLLTYVLLQKGASERIVSDKIKDRIQREIRLSTNPELFLFPLKKIHLYSLSGKGGPIETVILFSVIAFFILLIACINFINLATARAGKRATEVGIKKVIGASTTKLSSQFFMESILLAFISLGFALLLVELILPYFNEIAGKNITLQRTNGLFILSMVGITVLTGLLAGGYPALYMSHFQPVMILKRFATTGSGNFLMRRILVIVQFAISITLIIATVVVFRQLHFMQNKKLGLNKDNILYFPIDGSVRKKIPLLENELAKSRSILSISGTSHIPLQVWANGGGWSWEGKDPEQEELITFLGTDYNFLKTFQVKLNEGRYFSKEFGADGENSVVINQTFANIIGGKSVVGKRLSSGEQNFTIIGVVHDFNFLRVKEKIGPLLIYLNLQPNYLFVRVRHSELPQSLEYIKKVYHRFTPTHPFEYHFLDETYEMMFFSEKRLSRIFTSFAFLAIVISCLGIFGLASFLAEQKIKEIGIRKVLGASASGIVMLLSKEFMRCVLLANSISWPIAYYLMNQWLQDYAYRTKLSWFIFFASGITALAIALFTASFQALRAALSNPVEALRYE